MSFSQLRKNLDKNLIVVYKSDTIPSIYTKIVNYDELENIKQRNKTKPFILLVGSFQMLQKYVIIGKNIRRVRELLLNAPITIIYQPNQHFIKTYSWAFKTVAMRIPNLSALRKVILELNEPVISTSFNMELKGDKRLLFLEGWEHYETKQPSRIYNLNKGVYIR